MITYVRAGAAIFRGRAASVSFASPISVTAGPRGRNRMCAPIADGSRARDDCGAQSGRPSRGQLSRCEAKVPKEG